MGGGRTSVTLLPDSNKLQMTNWNEWKRSMTRILRMKGLMGYADGSVKRPARSRSLLIHITSTPGTPTRTSQLTLSVSLNPFDAQRATTQSTGKLLGVSPNPSSSQAKPLPHVPVLDEEEWDCLDAAAVSNITLNIKNQTIQSKFGDNASASEIWGSLCARFERTSGVLALQAQNRLNAHKYVDGHDLQSHLDTMSKSWQEALAVGVKIQDDEFCHILQSSLPPSWALFVVTLITVDDPVILETSLLTFADLKGPSSKSISPTSSTALISTAVTGSVCTNCGRSNRASDRCYRKGGGPNIRHHLGGGNGSRLSSFGVHLG
jgi:hypothetical protein